MDALSPKAGGNTGSLSMSEPQASVPGSEILRSILEGIGSALICYDHNDRIAYWNRSAEILFSDVRHVLRQGLSKTEWLKAREFAGYMPARRSTRGESLSSDFEEWLLPDGRRLMRERTAISGGHQLYVYTDITERLAAERETNRALEAERERYALLIEGTRDGVFDRDLRTGDGWYSPRAHEILGVADGSLNGMRAKVDTFLHADDFEAYRAQLTSAFERRDQVVATIRRLRHSDGGWRWIQSRARVVYDEEGRAIRLIGSWTDVTAEKEADERLKASEERYALMVEGTQDGIYDIDVTHDISWFSARAHEILGLPDGALNGARAKVLALTHPDDLAGYTERLRRANENKIRIIVTVRRLRHADGSWRWIRSRAVGVVSESGAQLRAVGSWTDITAERESEDRLRASEERYALMVEGTQDGIYDRDKITGKNWYSARAHEMLGLPDGALNGDRAKMLALVHPDDIAPYDETLREAAAQRSKITVTTRRLRHADGGWRWIKARARAIYAEDGTPVRAVGSWTDVTAEKEADERLRASEERYALMVEGTQDGLYDRDAVRNVNWYSARAHEMLGLPDGALNGDRSKILALTHPDDLDAYEENIRRAIERRAPINVSVLRLRHADGSWRWIQVRGRALYSDAGAPLRAVGSWTDVTAQREAEVVLRESEQNLRDAQRLARIGSWRRGTDGHLTWSQQSYELFQLDSTKPLDHERILLSVSPDDRAAVDLGFAAIDERDPEASESQVRYRVRLPDGSDAIFAELTIVERDAEGRIQSVHGTVQDITEQAMAAEAVRSSEARLFAILDTALVGFISVDEDGKIVNFNAEAAATFGYSATEIRGQSLDILLPSASRSYHREMVKTFAASAERQKAMSIWREVRGQRSDGSLVPLMAGVSKVKIAGKITMTVIFRDMSQIHAAEDELERLSEERERQVEEVARRSLLLQSVMDTITDGMAIVQDDAGAVLWNVGFVKVIAAARGGQHDLGTVPLRATMPDLLGLLGLDQETVASILRGPGEMRECMLDDGRALRVQVLRSGESSSLLWISDISRRRKEEAERMALQERLMLSQKSDAIVTIAGTVSHDFNNLLTIILGFATLGKSQLDVLNAIPAALVTEDPQQQRFVQHMAKATASVGKSLDNIISGATRGKGIVTHLTGFARRRPSDLSIGNLSRTLDSAAKLIGASLPTSISFSTSGIGADLPVRHDRGKIEQVLMNLCINSAHAIDGKAGSISVSVGQLRTDGGRADSIVASLEDPDGQRVMIRTTPDGWHHIWYGSLPVGEFVRVDVTDTGSGMSAETVQKMFDPFFTTKPKGQGTGLGLLSVSRIVEEHGGAVHARSREGTGTVFSFFLPVAECTESPVEAPAGDGQAAIADASPGTVVSSNLVLVVDDEEHLTELVQLSLERAGYKVEAFNDVELALQRFRSDPSAFSLVITDQTMPKITGIEFAGKLSELRPWLPVLLCTGYSAQALDEKKLPAGISGLLRKPFTPKDLLVKIRAMLGEE